VNPAVHSPLNDGVGCKNMMKQNHAKMVLACLIFCGGCASIDEHGSRIGGQPIVYPGVRSYIDLATTPLSEHGPEHDSCLEAMFLPFLLVDGLALTPAMDTILLPVDIVWIILHKEPNKDTQPTNPPYSSPAAGSKR